MRLKPLHEQVVVVTGASSGIGRTTAILLARAGATIVALSRSETHLSSLVAEIAHHGGTARLVVCDVTDLDQVQAAADVAEGWFGRIDTWVNVAGVLLYGAFERTAPEEFRRMIDINYMGTVHGSLVALPALRRAGGGALISVSSAEAFLTLPLHSAYAATKGAIDGAMDGLRRELIAERAPISVTVVRPAVIDTPIYRTTRNHLEVQPQAPPPFYDPVVVARGIAFAAAHPVRDLYAGGASRLMSVLQAIAPGLTDVVFGRFGLRFMRTNQPAGQRRGNLYAPLDTGQTRGGLPRRGRRFSLYTWLAVHRRVRLGLGLSALVVLGVVAGGRVAGRRARSCTRPAIRA